MWGIFCKIMSVPRNIVMDLNNAMFTLIMSKDILTRSKNHEESGHGLNLDLLTISY